MVPLLRMLIVAAYLGIASGVCFAIELADRPVRLLVVYQDSSTLLASKEVAEELSQRLATSSEAQFEIYNEYLDSVRFPDPDNLHRHADDRPESSGRCPGPTKACQISLLLVAHNQE